MIDTDFSEIASAYPWRIPYFPRFFHEIARAANLDEKSFVLDLACGSGELAAGIAGYCGEVLGIDKTAEMLSSGRELPANVRFLKADLNSESISIPRPPSLVTIGRAIPYFDRNVVMPFLDSVAGTQASVLVCGAGFSEAVAWLPSYNALCDRYRKRIVTQTFGGRAFFANSRWKLTRRIRVKGKLRRRPEEIYRSALSYPSLVRQILADPDRFVRELNGILAPYQDASGVITFEALSWGIEYRCQPAHPSRLVPALDGEDRA
jgi:SAM-dependent methyltransferase